jgi:hypothetical protein
MQKRERSGKNATLGSRKLIQPQRLRCGGTTAHLGVGVGNGAGCRYRCSSLDREIRSVLCAEDWGGVKARQLRTAGEGKLFRTDLASLFTLIARLLHYHIRIRLHTLCTQ